MSTNRVQNLRGPNLAAHELIPPTGKRGASGRSRRHRSISAQQKN